MLLRAYEPADCPALLRLFYDTVHAVCAADYTAEQLDAWATGREDAAAWDRSLRAHRTLVAVLSGEIAGFADLDTAAGYLDRLYVHRAYQRRGVATALCDALEPLAAGRARHHARLAYGAALLFAAGLPRPARAAGRAAGACC